MMEAKFLGELLKILAGRIGNVGPYDIATDLAKLTDVSRDAVLSELLGIAIQTDSCDHSVTFLLVTAFIGNGGSTLVEGEFLSLKPATLGKSLSVLRIMTNDF